MALPKISVALLLLVVACAAANEKSHVETKSDVPKVVPVDETKTVKLLNNNGTTTTPIPITTVPSNTTTSVPTTVSPSTTHAPNTTTVAPPTTHAPNTTTVAPPTTHAPNTTTVAPSTTALPNVTTTVPPTPTPAPAPGRHWDAPSFFGGMVLAFGLVAVGFVGYRFFYLGRGGAYHTL